MLSREKGEWDPAFKVPHLPLDSCLCTISVCVYLSHLSLLLSLSGNIFSLRHKQRALLPAHHEVGQ